MSYGVYLSAAGADVQTKRVQVLSNNLANVDTAGFKRDLAILQARHSEAIEQGYDSSGSRSVNDVGGGVFLDEVATDFSPGRMNRTGLPSDLAIEGEGFFVVRKDNQPMLTRAGNFVVAANGQLVTQNGEPVLAQDGQPVVINPQLPWIVGQGGVISQAGNQIPLAVVKPASLGDLVKVGDNMFRPLAPTVPVPPGSRNVRAGFLEMSGVQPTTAMMELIEASRAFEANVKMIQHQDQMSGALVTRLLRT